MRKKLFRASMVGFALSMTLVLSGCQFKNIKEEMNQSRNEKNEKRNSTTYQKEKIALQECVGMLQGYNVEDDKLLISTLEGSGTDENCTFVSHQYIANLDGSEVKEISNANLGENNYFIDFHSAGDNQYIGLLNMIDSQMGIEAITFVKYDADGNEIMRTNLSEQINDNLRQEYPISVALDKNHNTYICYEKCCVVIDSNGNMLGELKPEKMEWMNRVIQLTDGTVGVCYHDDEGKLILGIADADQMTLKDKQELSMAVIGSMGTGYKDFDFVYSTSDSLKGYNISSKTETTIMDYLESNISDTDSCNIKATANGEFFGYHTSEDGNEFSIYQYKKVAPEDIKDKQTITITCLEADEGIKEAAMMFNEGNNEYTVVINEYINEEDAETKLKTDIATGNVGDIIGLDGFDINQYIQKGVLEDLTPYYEADKEVKLEDMVDSLREACLVDGKMYYITQGFMIHSMLAPKKLVGQKDGWNAEEFVKLAQENKDSSRMLYTENKEYLLDILTSISAGDYIDWEKGECSFDSAEFKQILEFCNSGSNEAGDNGSSQEELIRSGKVLCMEAGVGLQDLSMYNAIYEDGFCYVGYPNSNKNGNYMTLWDTYGIYSKSENKEGAWKFLRMLMTKEYQDKMVATDYNNFKIPSRKDALELQNKKFTITEPFVDDCGYEIEPVEANFGYEESLGIKNSLPTQEMINSYMEFIDSIEKISFRQEDVRGIIIEEARAYFAGDKSLDDTVKLIQNRVSTYVNENR